MPAGRPITVVFSDISRPTPRTMKDVPSVTMKAGTFSLAMITPLMRPTSRAPATAAKNPMTTRGKERHAGIEGAADGERREHRGEAHHPADGKVDAGADDDEGLPKAEEQDGRDRDQDVLRVADGEEVDRAAVVERHGDEEEDDHQAEEDAQAQSRLSGQA